MLILVILRKIAAKVVMAMRGVSRSKYMEKRRSDLANPDILAHRGVPAPPPLFQRRFLVRVAHFVQFLQFFRHYFRLYLAPLPATTHHRNMSSDSATHTAALRDS